MEKLVKKPWYKQKTTRTAIGGILTAIAGVLTGAVDPATAVGTCFILVTQIFQRQGTETAK